MFVCDIECQDAVPLESDSLEIVFFRKKFFRPRLFTDGVRVRFVGGSVCQLIATVNSGKTADLFVTPL